MSYSLHTFEVNAVADHLLGLNPPQEEAVRHFKGPILVLAGAGSGKTRILTRRVAHLVLEHKIPPYAILAVTFTNKATEEMRTRLSLMLGPAAKHLWVATFHSAGLRMLRAYAQVLGYSKDFAVYDEQDSRNVLKRTFKELAVDDRKASLSDVDRIIDQAKNAYVLPGDLVSHFEKGKSYLKYDPNLLLYAEIYAHYQRALLASNAMDYGDLLVNAALILSRHPEILERYRRQIQFVLVDEFQDTNAVQYEIVRLLSAPANNLLVVGDDDQSIYAFRGATISNILDFERDYPGAKVVKLEQNYRSSANILETANAVIARNIERKKKSLWTESAAGAPVTAYVGQDETEEADFVAAGIRKLMNEGAAPRDIAVFYRVNAQSRALEESLISENIPYRIYGGLKFYDRKEIKDITAYLRILVNEYDSQAFLRVVNTPPRGIGAQTIKAIITAAGEKDSSLMAAAALLRKNNKNIEKFVALIEGLRAEITRLPLSQLIAEIMRRSDYDASLSIEKDAAAQSRLENLLELISIGRSLEDEAEDKVEVLRIFLDRISLTSSQELPVEENRDAAQKSPPNAVSLMTLHLAKGLEFETVFLTGLEEGLLPHYRSIEENSVEEERRLCYVGMTRAMKTLFVTRCHSRGMFLSGSPVHSMGYFRSVSRFAFDIPPTCVNLLSKSFLTDIMDAEDEAPADEAEEDLLEHEDEIAGDEFQPRTLKRRAARKKTFLGQIKTADDLKPKS